MRVRLSVPQIRGGRSSLFRRGCMIQCLPCRRIEDRPSSFAHIQVSSTSQRWMSSEGGRKNGGVSDSPRRKKAGNKDRDKESSAMGQIRGEFTQGKGDYKYRVKPDGTPELEDIRDDASVTETLRELGIDDQEERKDDEEETDSSQIKGSEERNLFDDAGDSDEDPRNPFQHVAPEDVGRRKRKVTDTGNEEFREKLLGDKRYMRQAGMHGVSDSEDWPDEEKHVRSMPMWMMWHYARSELDSEVERSEKEEKSAKPTALINLPMRDNKGRAYATGRRKTATARVWAKAGDGQFTVNGMPLAYYFPNLEERKYCMFPLIALEACGGFDVMCTVKGGGVSGQAGAIKHGLARALAKYDPYLKPTMKQYQLLKRDPRMVERKKPGQAKARKKFTWVKR